MSVMSIRSRVFFGQYLLTAEAIVNKVPHRGLWTFDLMDFIDLMDLLRGFLW